jgi:phosphatidylserine decarboxylase
MSVGHAPGQESHKPDQRKENVTEEEREDAARRIGGNLAPPTEPATASAPSAAAQIT